MKVSFNCLSGLFERLFNDGPSVIIRAFFLSLLIFSSPAQSQESSSLKILTYNIHHAEGTDGIVGYDRIANIIRQTESDIVALQEVDNGVRRTKGVDQAKKLAQMLGYEFAFGKALNFQGGTYGLAILSKGNINSSRTFALPYRFGQEPRVVFQAEVDLGNEWPKILFYNTHLCHISFETRLEQVQQILQIIPQNQKQLVLLAGDFNTQPDTAPMQLLWDRGWSDLVQKHNGIDYLLLSPGSNVQVKKSQIIDAPIASDHMPVFAELVFEKGTFKK